MAEPFVNEELRIARSMKFPLYEVDVVTNRIFRGNPAAAVLLDEWLPDGMTNISMTLWATQPNYPFHPTRKISQSSLFRAGKRER